MNRQGEADIIIELMSKFSLHKLYQGAKPDGKAQRAKNQCRSQVLQLQIDPAWPMATPPKLGFLDNVDDITPVTMVALQYSQGRHVQEGKCNCILHNASPNSLHCHRTIVGGVMSSSLYKKYTSFGGVAIAMHTCYSSGINHLIPMDQYKSRVEKNEAGCFHQRQVGRQLQEIT